MTTNNDNLTAFPGGVDNFQIPQEPADTYLSEAEADSAQAGNTLNHPQMHQAENEAINAIESNAALAVHDHSDPQGTDYSQLAPSAKHGYQLGIQNTHVTSDTHTAPTVAESASPDSSASTWHHTVGTSQNSIGDYQAVGGKAWNAVGLNTAPNNYFNITSPNSLPAQVAANSEQIPLVQGMVDGANVNITKLQGQLSSFNNYYQQRCATFFGGSFEQIAFTPNANINQNAVGGTAGNWVKVNLFSRTVWLMVHPFKSAHSGVDAQVEIYTQIKQSDGSWWAPNYLIFFPGAVHGHGVGSAGGEFVRDLTWQPDGNIVTSSLGDPGEENDVLACLSAPMPANIELVHYDSTGTPIEYTNQLPF